MTQKKEVKDEKVVFGAIFAYVGKGDGVCGQPALLRQNKQLQQKVALLESYIEGMQAGLRLGKKVSVYNGGKG